MACANVRSWVTNGLGAEVPLGLTLLIRSGQCVDARSGLRAILPLGSITGCDGQYWGFFGGGDDLCLANGRRVEREVASFT